MMEKGKRDRLIIILISVIAVLVLVLIYLLMIKPALNGLIIQGYNQAQSDIINTIITQINSNGYVQIPITENQSLILVPYQSPAGT